MIRILGVHSRLKVIPLDDLDRTKNDPVLSKELHVTERWGTYFYGFNNERPPFDNLLVRKAFASAIDRESLIKYVLKGGQGVAQTFISPGIPGYVDGVKEGVGYPYDPEAARKYLAEAGYPNGYFDIIQIKQVLEHIYDPKEFLSEARRILSDRGVVVIDVPNQNGLIPRIKILLNLRDNECGFLQPMRHFPASYYPSG